jgi:hypothetical protein
MRFQRQIGVGVCTLGIAILVSMTGLPKRSAAESVPTLRMRTPVHRYDPVKLHQKRDEGNYESYNWAGYAVTGAKNSSTDVRGSWIVPSVDCSSAPNGYSSFWVGIDGFNSNTVEQTGTDSDCVSLNGRPATATYYAWFEFYPNPSYEILFPHALVPGDVVTAEVKYDGQVTQGRHDSGARFIFTITDVTQNEAYSGSSVVNNAQLSSVEWIAEAPSSRSGILPLANFRTVLFNSASATVQNLTGPLGSFGTSLQQVTMVSEASGNPVKAKPSAPNGNGFSVAWLSPGP